VQSVVMGKVIQAGTGMNPARQAAIGGGVPIQVPAYTVNRVCGPGAQSIVSAYLEIVSGNMSCAIARSMKSCSMYSPVISFREAAQAVFNNILNNVCYFSQEISGDGIEVNIGLPLKCRCRYNIFCDR